MYSYVDLRSIQLDKDAVYLVNEAFARKHCLIPIGFHPDLTGCIYVAMSDPDDFIAVENARLVSGYEIETVRSDEAQIRAQIDQYFNCQTVEDAVERYRKEHKTDKKDGKKEEDSSDRQDEYPVVQIVRSIMERAVRMRASDIHFEPMKEGIRIRCRVDGSLIRIVDYDQSIHDAIISRVKIISNMDISEKRKPQDGRMTLTVDQQEYEVRVSSIPAVHGEKIVMRLNTREFLVRDKWHLGMTEEDIRKVDVMLSHPHGIILVTGPTGSGKSTTLYTALNELNREEVNVVTVEDPVEAYLEGANQIQVNPKAGLTFESALRAILRQDPDIIMVGEIRDAETAEIAVRASITGHLVVSTLHTNSTAASIDRLLNMKIESYLIADALTGVIAQRLVRKLCACRRCRPALPEEKAELGIPPDEMQEICEPVGCVRCNHTGYDGRTGVFEVMKITPAVRRAISKMQTADGIREIAVREGMSTLRESAVRLVKTGITSLEEIRKIEYED